MRLSEKLLSILFHQKKIFFFSFFFSGHNTEMFEITIGNCYKCDLETIVDSNNCQYF